MQRPDIDAAWNGIANCRDCGIRDLVLFADLHEEDFSLIHLPINDLSLAAGDSLYRLDDPGTAVFTIRTGLVKLVQFLPDGSQRIVRLLSQGCVAGLEALVGHTYEHAAIVVTPATVCRIPCAIVDKLNRETPRLHAQLLQRWHRGLQQADQFLTGMSTGSARRRLARLLLHLVDGQPDQPVHLMVREDLGALLGVTMETASRTVAEFKRGRLITPKSHTSVLCDVAGLEAVAHEG